MSKWNAPGMPEAGPGFSAWANSLISKDENETNDEVKARYLAQVHALYDRMLYCNGQQRYRMPVNGKICMLPVISGHPWGITTQSYGPRAQADVMVIGKMLDEDDVESGRCWAGRPGRLLLDICTKYRFKGLSKWYMTNVIKTPHPIPSASSNNLKRPWVYDWAPILRQELRIVRPKFILCLGSDAIKALFGTKATIQGFAGQVVPYSYPVNEAGEETVEHTAQVLSCQHPSAILRAPEQQDTFEHELLKFYKRTKGVRWDIKEEGLDHRVVDDITTLRSLREEIERDCEQNLIAVDAEWNGEHPQNENAYLRTVQISWKHKAAACISLRHPGGSVRFVGGLQAAYDEITAICRNRRIAGQFLNSDMEWLQSVGIDLSAEFEVADTWQQTQYEAENGIRGGFDTGLAAHAINETDDFGLTAMTLRYTDAPRYDVELIKWKKQHCRKLGIKEKHLEGFGLCPAETLEPYANMDVCVTRRLAVYFQQKLAADQFGNNCWEAFWMSMRAAPAALEINTTGLCVDRNRLDRLTELFIRKKQELENEIRTWAKWPNLNLQSPGQVREYLFGEKYNKKAKPGMPVERIRPPGAKSLGIEPLITTDKRPMRWEEVKRNNLEDEKTAAAKGSVLAILSYTASKVPVQVRGSWRKVDYRPQIQLLRNYRFVAQLLKSVLRVPLIDKETGGYQVDENDNYKYQGGLPGAICSDGRVRTYIYLTKETGRWSSARPPLQNIGNRREEDLKRVLGEDYMYPARSIMVSPPGYLFVEADYVGAELYGAAIMSGDPRLLEHAARNILDEHDPNYYDIHSNIAVLAFSYNCAPTKEGLASIGKKHMRIVAKAVVFGLMYGRGAKAIAMAAKEEGVDITVDDAQRVIDTVFNMYAGLVPFFASCRARATGERWLCGCFGRFRRFPLVSDQKLIGAMERQAMNVPIQGMIADCVARAADNIYSYRKRQPDIDYKLALQIHDAVLLQVAIRDVPHVVNHLLPECMTSINIYPSLLDGTPVDRGPYKLGIDISLYEQWGVKLTKVRGAELGLDPQLIASKCK